MQVELNSPCKVNFILNILGKREDGFHQLETVMHRVPVFDLLRFERAGSAIELSCDNPALPVDSTNLVFRAASKFLDAAKIRDGVRIHLEKRIPLAAGLGGGSGNAAITLQGLNQLFGRPLESRDLHQIAAALGSDVPFFLQDQPALATGRGEKVAPVAPFRSLDGIHIFLAHPGFGVSTPWAYRNLARFPQALNGKAGRAEKLIELLRTSLETASAEFYNALEAPVFEKFPILVIFRDFFAENGATVAMMSGSGSTTFALLRGREKAETLEERFKRKFGRAFWTRAVSLHENQID